MADMPWECLIATIPAEVGQTGSGQTNEHLVVPKAEIALDEAATVSSTLNREGARDADVHLATVCRSTEHLDAPRGLRAG